MYYTVYFEYDEGHENYNMFGDDCQFQDEDDMWQFIDELKEDGAILITASEVRTYSHREVERIDIYNYENGIGEYVQKV